ncbi:hypothetical protein DICA3_C17612 [Diutina catenulata]
MSFKVNDYQAFLASIYDKQGGERPGPPRPKEEPLSPQSAITEDPTRFPLDLPPPQYLYNKNPPPVGFPTDFDFGLMAPSGMSPPYMNYNTEFAAEVGAGAPIKPEEAGPLSLPTWFKQEPPPSQIKSPLSEHTESPGFDPPSPGGRPRGKSAHNIIEQRYRNKINDKFTALQMSVPTLRVCARRRSKKGLRRRGSSADEDDDDDDDNGDANPDELEGLEPARKLNKGTILTKSVEYIKFLEHKNERMSNERNQLIMKAKMLGIDVTDFMSDAI